MGAGTQLDGAYDSSSSSSVLLSAWSSSIEDHDTASIGTILNDGDADFSNSAITHTDRPSESKTNAT